MKKNIFFILGIVFLSGLFLTTCNKDDLDPNNSNNSNNPVGGKNLRHYFMSASYGDLISLTIDADLLTYAFNNETTGESGNGELRLSNNPNLSGIYVTNIDGRKQYTIELPNVAVVSSMPMGNTRNKICVGISSDIHEENNYTMADLSGRFIFINFDDTEKNPANFWGGANVNSDGSYSWGWGNTNVTTISFTGGAYGTVSFDENNKSRLLFTESGGLSGIGSIYPGKLLLMDNGPGYGFTIAVKYPDYPISQQEIAGNYKMINITTFSGESTGYFSIPASGKNLTYYELTNEGHEYMDMTGATISSFERVSTLNNVFKVVMNVMLDDGTWWEVTNYFILLPGEMLMYFSTEPGPNDEIIISAYGLALKVK